MELKRKSGRQEIRGTGKRKRVIVRGVGVGREREMKQENSRDVDKDIGEVKIARKIDWDLDNGGGVETGERL